MIFSVKNNLVLVYLSFLFVFSVGAFAQKSQDTLSKYSYTDLHYLILDSEKDSLRLYSYINEYKQRAFRENNTQRISSYYKSFVFYQKKENRLTLIDSALHYAYKTNDKVLIGDVYLTKGTLYHSIKDYQQTLDNYLKANDYISQTDDAYKKHRIKNHIGVIKNYLGYYEDAENLFKECVAYFGQNQANYNMQRGYVSSLEGLAWSYTKTGRIKESNEILQTALISVQKGGFSELDGHYMIFKQGINDYFLGNYEQAILKIEEKLPFLYKNEDFAWATVGDFYIGKAYWNKKEKEKAISYFDKVNQIFETQNYTHPDLRESYELLIGYYKNQNDKDKQLQYIEQLVKADDVYNKSHKHLIRKIHKEYETRDLLQAKRELETSLYFEKYKTVIISIIALILGISVVVYVFLQKKAKKTAQQLIQKIESLQQQTVVVSKAVISSPKPISDEKVLQILDKLNMFEQQQKFLKTDITLNKLADEFKTNATYLSFVINSNKNQNFKDYINNLKINYILNELYKNDYESLKKYSLEAYAEKAGYTNTDTFSRAFKTYTGISPSVFIKELQNKKYLKSA